MRVELDAKLKTADDHDVGSIERAIVDPSSNEVTEFVIATGGLFGRDLLLPRFEIDRATADGDVVRLRITKAEVESLPPFLSANYVPPPAGWAGVADYPFGVGGYLWPAVTPIPSAGVGPSPEAYSGGIYTPSNVENPSLAKGDVVVDRDGDAIGVVDDVMFEIGSGRLSGFDLRIGNAFLTLFGGGETVTVDRSQVERVEEARVYLKVDKNALRSSR